MIIVLDTNIVVSGMLWRGTPRSVLDGVRAGKIELATSAPLLKELVDVLSRPKFQEKIRTAGMSPHVLAGHYARLARKVIPVGIHGVVKSDPDDDQVIACAVAASADAIVSGDQAVLGLKYFRDIPIITAAEIVKRANLSSHSIP